MVNTVEEEIKTGDLVKAGAFGAILVLIYATGCALEANTKRKPIQNVRRKVAKVRHAIDMKI